MSSPSLFRPLVRVTLQRQGRLNAALFSTTAPSRAEAPRSTSIPPRPAPNSSSDDATSGPSFDVEEARKLASTKPFPAAVNATQNPAEIDWTQSYHGLSTKAVSPEAAKILATPLTVNDIEVKPDGIIYLPEIKYRRVLNDAFGPGGWGLVPRGETVVGDRIVTREYALIVDGRFISQAQGENQYFSLESLPAAVEGCKSNALMRCCKDLGIASELWDPVFIRQFRTKHAEQVWCTHVVNKKKKQLWSKKGVPVSYPYARS